MKIKERIVLWGIIPKQGSYTDLIIIWDIRKKIWLKQKEITASEIVTDNVTWSITWNNEKDKDVKIDFTEPERNIIKSALLDLDKDKKLTDDHVELYKTFVMEAPKKD